MSSLFRAWLYFEYALFVSDVSSSSCCHNYPSRRCFTTYFGHVLDARATSAFGDDSEPITHVVPAIRAQDMATANVARWGF